MKKTPIYLMLLFMLITACSQFGNQAINKDITTIKMTVDIANPRSPLLLKTEKIWNAAHSPTNLWDKILTQYDTCPEPETLYIDWGDGTQDSTTNKHNYKQQGTYAVTVTAKNLYRLKLDWPQGHYSAMNWIKTFTIESPTLMSLDFALASTRGNLELKNCNNLRYLSCSGIGTDSLDLSNCTNMEWLDCRANKMKYLNIGKCTNLKAIECGVNYIDTLDISSATQLIYLECENTLIKSLNITNAKNLETLHCRNMYLKELDITNNPKLSDLYYGIDGTYNLYVKKGSTYEKGGYGVHYNVKIHVKE
ncbi:PKD domain-containing protein [Parabacteroides sp. APC149_11_2_Y6]